MPTPSGVDCAFHLLSTFFAKLPFDSVRPAGGYVKWLVNVKQWCNGKLKTIFRCTFLSIQSHLRPPCRTCGRVWLHQSPGHCPVVSWVISPVDSLKRNTGFNDLSFILTSTVVKLKNASRYCSIIKPFFLTVFIFIYYLLFTNITNQH